MAYIFPINPVDGQLYPFPSIPGSLQYIWNAGQNAWLIYSPLGVTSVSGILPIVVTNQTENAVVSILPATVTTAGAMTPEDKIKLDNLPTSFGTVTSVAAGTGLLTSNPSNAPITSEGSIRLLPPSGTAIGGVKAGPGINIAPDGTISSNQGTVTSINCVDGIIGAPNPITDVGTIALRPASNLLIGGVIVGAGLSVDGAGLLSVASDIRANGLASWGSFRVEQTDPPTFTRLDSFNVQSVTYLGGPQPITRITFTNPLLDDAYAFLSNARVFGYGGSLQNAQTSALFNLRFKTSSYADIVLQTTTTTNNTVAGGEIQWNKYIAPGGGVIGGITEVDFAAFDTRAV